MKKIILILILVCLSSFVLAEEKTTFGIVPKLSAEEMQDAPILSGGVYPPMGVPCTNFTYYARYQDKQGREPNYIRIWHNSDWHDLTFLEGTPKNGATYVYYYVPTSGESNFYYYEASNGKGKARASIIDSPDNGPVLFSEKFDNNEIILLDKEGKKIWEYPTNREWVEGVAISKDSNYIAAVTGFHIYLFSKNSIEPLWNFCTDCNPESTKESNMEGVAISKDGSYIAATLQGKLYFFEKQNNQPLWTVEIESGCLGVDMSDDAGVIAVGIGDKILIFDKNGNKLGDYKPSHPEYEQTGNFYQPDVTPDGKYVAVSTGCPDRRAYLFSGEGELIFRSEQLTYDSPVHKSAISDDGSVIAYSADNMQGKEIVFLFDNKGKKLWGFSSQEDGTARAVSISNDGTYIAAGTSKGSIYLFSKESKNPKWRYYNPSFFTQFGDIKLNSDGSLLAAGGTTKKIYLFSRNSNKPLWEYKANTWVTKIDFSGEYIVAGTGPREYFFEGNSVPPTKLDCKEIIQHGLLMNYLSKRMGIINNQSDQVLPEGYSLGEDTWCGNNVCESPIETKDNCAEDCSVQVVENGDLMKDCGDGVCEAPETKNTCCDDCGGCMGVVKRAGDDNVDENTRIDNAIIKKQDERKNFFSVIIDFFRKLFGYKESAKQVMEDTEGGKKVYVDGKEVSYKTENEVQPGTAMRVIETETGEKIYVESSEYSNTKVIIETTEKDGSVVENTVATDVK